MILFFMGCYNSENEFQKVQVDDNTTRYILIDDGPPLSQIFRVEPIGNDSLLILDDTGQLQLFVKNKFVRTIGTRGRGPCEYNGVRHFTFKGDSLYILDPSTTKIVYYSINTGKCLGELISPKLSDFSTLIRLDGVFYLLHTEYSVTTNLNKVLLFKMSDNAVMTPLGLQFSDVNPNVLLTPVRAYSLMKSKDNVIYIILPLSDKIWMYNIESHTTNYHELSLDGYDDLKDYKMSSNMDDLIRILDNSEAVFGLYLLENAIAVVTRTGIYPDARWKIKFYDYNGNYIGVIETDLFVIRVMDHFFSRLTEDLDNIGALHPYIIFDQDYRISLSTN